jgi:hypothetical protein
MATLLLIVLVGVAGRWRSADSLGVAETLAWCGLLLVGATLFGVGVGAAVSFPLVILLLFPGSNASPGLRLGVFLLSILVVVSYRHAYEVAARFDAPVDAGLPMLLALASYWQNAVAMVPHLAAAGLAGLLMGFAYDIRTYPNAVGYATGTVFAVGFMIGLVISDPRRRRLLLALFILSLSVYAVIAAGRATLCAIGRGVALGASNERYHYVASIPATAIVCLLLARFAEALRLPVRVANGLLVVWLVATGVLYARSSWRIDLHPADRQLAAQVVTAIDRAIRQAPEGQTIFIPNEKFAPAVFHDGFSGSAALYTIFFPSRLDGRVRFVEPDATVRERARPGSRLATVLMPPPAGAAPR